MNKKEIFQKAHLNESSDMAREYFKDSGLDYSKIKISDLYKLREFILDEIYPLLADKTYSMVRELTMDRKIDIKFEKKKDLLKEAYLYTNGSYFTKRQAISFEEEDFIGFVLPF